MSTAHDVGEDVNPVETLAAHVVGTRFEDLPQDAVNAAKTFILDSIGVGVAGSDGPWVRELIETAKQWGAGEDSRVFVHGTRRCSFALLVGPMCMFWHFISAMQ